MKKLQETLGDVWNMYDQDTNPLQDIYLIETQTPKQVKAITKKIRTIEGVEAADYGGLTPINYLSFQH